MTRKQELAHKIEKNCKTITNLVCTYWGQYRPEYIQKQIDHLNNKNKIYEYILNR